MSKGKKESFFWTSYSDLMTSLFFVMLVLFVISVVIIQKSNPYRVSELETENARLKDSVEQLTKWIGGLEGQIGELTMTIEQSEHLQQIEKQFNSLGEETIFKYDAEKKMFTVPCLEGISIFEQNKDKILPCYDLMVKDVGKDIERILEKLYSENPQLSYLLIIEGTAAIPYQELKAGTYDADNQFFYELSYRRALACYNRWKNNGLDIRKYNAEVLICGSGFNGTNRDMKKEDNNKRFTIQIVPKVQRTEKE